MFVYGKFLMFKLTDRDWTVGHTKTFVIIMQKNKSNKIIHVKILGKKKKDIPFPQKFPMANNSTIYKALGMHFWEIKPRRNHLTIQPTS